MNRIQLEAGQTLFVKARFQHVKEVIGCVESVFQDLADEQVIRTEFAC
jgi:aminoglycoside N3'-acetyltransferase